MKYYTSVYILLCIKEMFQITNFSRKKSKVTATKILTKKLLLLIVQLLFLLFYCSQALKPKLL